MESLVWLIPFLFVKREERRERMKEKIKGSRENEETWRRNEMAEKTFFSKRMFQDPQTRQMN